MNLLPVMISPSRLLFEPAGVSSPACSIYPEVLTEVTELLRYIKVVGWFLDILTPSQAPVIALLTVLPSSVKFVCANSLVGLPKKDQQQSFFKEAIDATGAKIIHDPQIVRK